MKTVDVDFNDLARHGLVRVAASEALSDILSGEIVLLVEEAEGMALKAVLAEKEDSFLYFRIIDPELSK